MKRLMARSAESKVFAVESQYAFRFELGTSRGGGGGAHLDMFSIGECASRERGR